MIDLLKGDCLELMKSIPDGSVDAIITDFNDVDNKWYDINHKWSNTWPNISVMGTPPEDAKEWDGVPDKFENHFSEKPGEGK